MQVGQLADLRGVERAAFALLGRGPPGVPHEVVGDQQPASFERFEQGGMALDGPGGLIGELTKAVIERAPGAELDDHLG